MTKAKLQPSWSSYQSHNIVLSS